MLGRERPLRGVVVVITGASSGNGRAAAHAFAREGARLVLAARRRAALEEAVIECERLGAQAIAVPTDVADADAVEKLAQAAVSRFGGIDVWINNAAVLHFGRIDETPVEVLHRVVETNLLGCIHGARAAVGHFRARGRGTLINTGSVLSTIGQPYATAYVATKFAIRGMTEALREELQDAPGIQVCGVLPFAIDTPVYQRAANFTGRPVGPIWPLYDPAVVADTMVSLARRPRREVFAGKLGALVALHRALAPALTERIVRLMIDKIQLRSGAAAPSYGNVLEPIHDRWTVRGGWRPEALPARGSGKLALGLAVAGVAAAAALAYRRSRR